MVYDGLGYLIVLSASNVFNFTLYISYRHVQDVQSAGVSVCYAVTWIMSQRLLTHLHEVYVDGRNHVDQVIALSKNSNTTRGIRRSLFKSELKDPDCELTADLEMSPVQVRVERISMIQM